jgi:hypothetical protein
MKFETRSKKFHTRNFKRDRRYLFLRNIYLYFYGERKQQFISFAINYNIFKIFFGFYLSVETISGPDVLISSKSIKPNREINDCPQNESKIQIIKNIKFNLTFPNQLIEIQFYNSVDSVIKKIFAGKFSYLINRNSILQFY